MSALMLAVVGAVVIGGALVAVVCWPRRPAPYANQRAAAGPLLDKTEPPW